MSSRSFPAKRESSCAACGGPILIGQTVLFRNREDKAPVHEICPKRSPAPAPSSTTSDSDMVFVGAWIRWDRSSILLDAIKEAKRP